MSNAYPYRVAIWRRALESLPRVVRWLTLAAPALLGGFLLLFAILTIGGLLSTEIELADSNSGQIIIETDCPAMFLEVALWPWDVSVEERSDGAEVPTVELNLSDSVTDPGCGTARLTIVSTEPRLPELVSSGSGVSVTEDGQILIDLESGALPLDPHTPMIPDDPRASPQPAPNDGSLLLRWPGLFRYSDRGHGWINRWLGASSAGISFRLEWHAVSDSESRVPMDVSVQVMAPLDYDVSYVWDYGLTDRNQGDVAYTNYMNDEFEQRLNHQVAKVRFRAPSHEAKVNYVLLAGGAIIGLGVTLLVESLIAVLFRLDHALTRKQEGGESEGAGDPETSSEDEASEEE